MNICCLKEALQFLMLGSWWSYHALAINTYMFSWWDIWTFYQSNSSQILDLSSKMYQVFIESLICGETCFGCKLLHLWCLWLFTGGFVVGRFMTILSWEEFNVISFEFLWSDETNRDPDLVNEYKRQGKYVFYLNQDFEWIRRCARILSFSYIQTPPWNCVSSKDCVCFVFMLTRED